MILKYRILHVSTQTGFVLSASYPDTEEGADRLVVTSFQLHVAPVVELFDTAAPPQDSVTPGRDTTLPAEGKTHTDTEAGSRVRNQTHMLLTLY